MKGGINGPACVPTHLRRGLLGVELEGERGEVEAVLWIVGYTEKAVSTPSSTIIPQYPIDQTKNPKTHTP